MSAFAAAVLLGIAFIIHATETSTDAFFSSTSLLIYDDLATCRLAPAEHVVDTAYLAPAHIEWAQRVHGITLLGPLLADNSRQAKAASGLDKAAFTIDWNNEQAICPRGATSASWTKLSISGHTYLQARFAESDCRLRPDRARCTSSALAPAPSQSCHGHCTPSRHARPARPADRTVAASVRDPRRHRGNPLAERTSSSGRRASHFRSLCNTAGFAST
ncbi:hypothetical protein [Streptomyces sp. NPDC017991]|uniref:hypothetical protein n=1 Tax=Streptomyces sp. NPDC017991 TaxID=3365026 RepID=UPI0037B9A8F7